MKKWIEAVYEDMRCFIKLFYKSHIKYTWLRNNIIINSTRTNAEMKKIYRKKIVQIGTSYSHAMVKYKTGKHIPIYKYI